MKQITIGFMLLLLFSANTCRKDNENCHYTMGFNNNSPIDVYVSHTNIEFEVWEYRSWIFTHFGKIVNDTTFIINKRKNDGEITTYTKTLNYKFKQFSPKPDSTNVYVK